MKESEVNKLIINKIKNSDTSEGTKKFLVDILNWEMTKSHEVRPQFRDDFMKHLEKCYKK
jgi:hypothetical protein